MCNFPIGMYNETFQMQISYQWTQKKGKIKKGENDTKLILSHLWKLEGLKLLKLTDKFPWT